MTRPRLTSDERGFFAALDRVVYGNPFADDRAELIKCLVPGMTPESVMADREALVRVVEPRIQVWRDVKRREQLPPEELQTVLSALLYVIYHRHVPAIDALIARQISSSALVAAHRLGDDLITDMMQLGLPERSAVLYLGFFFQLRRAFHFIARALPGNCDSMRTLRRSLWSNVFTNDMRTYQGGLWTRLEDFSTLLLGETGTGKGEAAAAIGRSQFIPYLPDRHCFATRFTESFVAINLSQYPESLIESELFGHRKGAFTGAITDHEGVFARCSEYGALFLDEIGEASTSVQIKLLRVLQERTFAPLGGHEMRRFAGRVVAATNRSLAALRASGRFRDDFYYRLCSDVIEVPTLRRRIAESREELHELAAVLVCRVAGEVRPDLQDRILVALERDLPRDYPWPGNVRELEQAVRRILLTGHYSPHERVTIAASDEQLPEMVRSGSLSAEELLDRYCAALYRRLGTYAEVAARIGLDRRTARRHITAGLARMDALSR